MKAGPRAETRTVQKFIVVGVFLGLVAMMALSALDHRFGWSKVPTAVCVIGEVLVATGLCLGMLTIVQNSYTAATVRIEEGQTLASTGLYKFVRHPMYAGNVLLMTGIPLALGSYWGLLILLPGTLILVFRILDEEKMLTQELPGYSEYKQHVHYRLVPYVW
jgi:protein-S-isoprenylcysteine O-methyltransferase Ste14